MKHLDLGCGDSPRNPYSAEEVHGVDIYLGEIQPGSHFKICDFVSQPLPYQSSSFESVSAFDVLEHIPRQVVDHALGSTKYPFIELMNEIHRILKPNGLFYAVTPAYPAPEVFQDPTHVNFITEGTHNYFCGEIPYATRYGFTGKFEAIESEWIYAKYAETAERSFVDKIKNLHKKLMNKSIAHFVWQLKAIK